MEIISQLKDTLKKNKKKPAKETVKLSFAILYMFFLTIKSYNKSY